MRVRMLAIGTRGDVQPYVALGLGLQRAGYRVSVATTANFKTFVEGWGLPCLTSDLDLQAAVGREKQGPATGGPDDGASRRLGRGRKARWAVFHMLLDETWRLSQGADLLLYSSPASLTAPHVAEKLAIPALPALLQPYLNPTREFPAVMMPALPLGGRYNRLTYAIFERLTWTFVGRAINRWRRDVLRLPPHPGPGPFTALRRGRVPTLYGISPTVVPRPAEWGEHVHVTGYWFLPPAEDWSPPAALADFLQAGPAPVYVGFGSMASRRPEEMAGLVLDAVRRAGVRAVVASGWGGLSSSGASDNVLLIGGAPHDWLFPRMAAVVHHGGAGTTTTGLRAGIPTVIVPFGGDQPFWGRRVAALGAGPPPISRRRLTAERLASAIRAAVETDSIRQRAAAVGETIRAEDGVGNAVRVIEQVVRPTVTRTTA